MGPARRRLAARSRCASPGKATPNAMKCKASPGRDPAYHAGPSSFTAEARYARQRDMQRRRFGHLPDIEVQECNRIAGDRVTVADSKIGPRHVRCSREFDQVLRRRGFLIPEMLDRHGE